MRDGQLRRHWKSLVLFYVIVGFFVSRALALDVAQVLPAGVRSPAVRTGFISGIGQRYASDGSLVTLSDLNSIQFDSDEIARIEPRVRELVSVLNQFGQQGLGDALHLGVLRIDVQPEVRYDAPLFAYGVTPTWTVAFGVPIVNYRNRIRLSQTNSNVGAIRAQLGGLAPELDQAFDDLERGLVTGANNELAAKGYKPLVDRNETIVGDVQLASLYRFFATPTVSALARTVVNLPTGPADDPDDLADLNVFGQSAIDQIVIATWQMHRYFRLAGRAGYRFNVPDRIVRRVPLSATDALPSADTKESVRRKIGDTASIGATGMFTLTKTFGIGYGYEALSKQADSFEGERGANYGLLARDTAATSLRMRAGFAYDTTRAFFDGESLLPVIFSYEFSDVVRGTNVERQTIHELWLTLFF